MTFVVATRDAVRAAPFLEALRPLGLVGVAMPVTTTVPAERSAVAAALASLRPGDLVGLASARASERIAEVVGRHGDAAGLALEGVGWWAVGESTAAPLRQLGVPVSTAPHASAAGLAAALLAAGAAGRRVLLPRAEDGREEAALALRRGGAHVDEVVVYRTAALAPDAAELAEGLARWRAGEVAVAALFAPSQVSALQAVLAACGRTLATEPVLFAAIGDTTAQALAAVGVGQRVVASAPTPEAMANAVASRYPPRR